MKFFENTKTIIAEVAGVTGGYLWAVKTKWQDYEPLILLVVSSAGLILSILSRFLSRKEKEESEPITHTKNYTTRKFRVNNEEFAELAGVINLDTVTWKTKVNLPLFKEPPKITFNRNNGKFRSEPVLSEVTTDSFTASIISSTEAGNWNWRAIGQLNSIA